MNKRNDDIDLTVKTPMEDLFVEELPSILHMTDLSPSEVYTDQKRIDTERFAKRLAQSTGIAALMSSTLFNGSAGSGAAAATSVGSTGGATGFGSALATKLGIAGVASFIAGTAITFGFMSSRMEAQEQKQADMQAAYETLEMQYKDMQATLNALQKNSEGEVLKPEAAAFVTSDKSSVKQRRRGSSKSIPALKSAHLTKTQIDLSAEAELATFERGVNLYRSHKYDKAQTLFEDYLSRFSKGQLRADAELYLFEISLRRHYVKDAVFYGRRVVESGRHQSRRHDIAVNYLKAASEIGACEEALSVIKRQGISLTKKERRLCGAE